MIEVFAYGTLRDPEYQLALFGRVLPMRPATLPGWLVVVADGGYLSLVRAEGESAAGDLVALDTAALALADAWEEVPLYERLPVDACAGGGTTAAFVYVRPTASRERAPAGALAAHDRATVLAAIRAFRCAYDRTSSESA